MYETPTLTKRRLQAQIIGPIYEEMMRQIGEDKAAEILDTAIRNAAIAEGQYFAEKAAGQTSMRDFISLYDLWTADGALEIDVLEVSETRFNFNVIRCRYAELYKDMALGKIGHLLSCNRDGTFCEGYDPNITLKRDQTIMAGAPCCTFRYSYTGPDVKPQPAPRLHVHTPGL